MREVDSDEDSASFTNIELSDGSGNRGFVSGGIASTTTGADSAYKKFKVVVTTALTGAAAGVTLQQALASVYTTHNSLTIQVTPAGNAVVVGASDQANAALASGDKTAANGGTLATAAEVAFSLESDGSVSTWTKYFVAAVRPNNPWGLEVGGINGSTSLPSGYSGETDYKQGDACSNSTKYWVYKNETHGTGHNAEEGDYWQEALLHSADGLTSTIKEANDA